MNAGSQPDFAGLRADLRGIIGQVVGTDITEIDDEAPLMDYLTSSLSLLAGVRLVYDRFGVLVPIRLLLEGAVSLKMLSAFIDQALQAQDKALHEAPRPTEDADAGPGIALLPSQRHVGFLMRYSDGASAAYNESLAIRLEGPMNTLALQVAIQAVIERYEAARAVLSPSDDALFLVGQPFDLTFTQSTPAEIDKCVAALAAEPFLAGARMLRAHLVRACETGHVLLLVSHAVIADREALKAMAEDVAEFHNAFVLSKEPHALPPAVQLTAYMAWRSDAAAKRAAADLAYWQNAFSTGAPLLHLPCDRQRPSIKSYAGARVSVTLKEALCVRLLGRPDLDPSAILFGAYTAFLHRISGQDDIVVGVRSTAIIAEGQKRTTGPTHEMLPVQSAYDPQSGFADHVRLGAARLAKADEHRWLSLAELIRLVNVPRDQSRSALFSAGFRMEYDDQPRPFENLSASFITIPAAAARYDIELIPVCASGSIQLLCDFSTDLFDSDTILRWLDGLAALLLAGLIDDERPCGLLPVMQEEELRTLVEEWNATERPYPPEETLYDLISDQARRSAERTALCFGGETLTYSGLMDRVAHLAARLTGAGLRKGGRVAILLDRSPDLVAGMLAVWRAGGAYVPIDPDLPEQRIGFMLADAGVAGVLTSRALAGRTGAASQAFRIFVEDTKAHPPQPPAGAAPGMREDSAYVIYTSGSTGQPKGVEIRHGALLNCILGTRELIGFNADDRLLALTTPSFDISTVELFVPLVAGGVLELGEDYLLADGARLAARIDRCKPSFVQATPSSWKAVLAAGWNGDPNLRMAVAGEAVTRGVAEQLLSKGGKLFNLYGPTETTVYVTGCEIKSDPGQPIRIGRALPNTRLYILDGRLQPVPVGVTGQLYIGGDGLARGYVGRPELTRERFVPNPFRPGELLYQTGDLARYLVGGDIVWLGRIDNQVKIHGYRVELEEIEAALRSIEDVHDAVATTWLDASGEKQLVAHIIAKAHSASAARLRDRLRDVLPAALIPPYILFRDRFPLTASGKIDRGALPPPEPGRRLARADAGPATPTERLLSEVWAKLLGVAAEGIGRDDDFLDLGGHSLLLSRLMADMRRLFGVTFSLRAFFEASSLKGLAALIDEARRSPPAQPDPCQPMPTIQSGWGKERMAFLHREAELPSNIAAARGLTFQAPAEIKNVFLTGATGFLGGYILNELLRGSGADIHCLVRAKKGLAAKARIEQQLRDYALWQDDERWRLDWDARVHVVSGDIILPRLGLADRMYESLARETDCIIHSAAHVNFIYPYEALKATNVLGLHEVIRFALHARLKPMHYISTAAIWPMGSEQTFFESDPLEHGKLLNLGYDEAKWVSEKCIVNAAERGLMSARYRPGEIGGDSKTGRCVLNHFLLASLKGFLQFGAMPLIDTRIDVAPVDYVAKAIVHLAVRGNPLSGAYHLTNPRSWHMSKALDHLRDLGYQFDEVRFDELRRALLGSDDFSENALFPYQTILENMEERSLQLPNYDCEQTLRELEGSGITCPPADAVLFETYFRYLRDIDFLPAPTRKPYATAGRLGSGGAFAEWSLRAASAGSPAS
jgi:amino acid adenylation domain-containing protein/thioester reductase-like protein